MSIKDAPNPIVAQKPQDPVGLVQGQTPGSIEEWYVAQALDYFQASYSYQFSINGGRGVVGGLVIDFVVWTPIGGLPVFVQGKYWHNYRNDPEREISLAAASHHFKNQAVELWEDEVNEKEKARTAVRRKVIV